LNSHQYIKSHISTTSPHTPQLKRRAFLTRICSKSPVGVASLARSTRVYNKILLQMRVGKTRLQQLYTHALIKRVCIHNNYYKRVLWFLSLR
jgi:hypothetical protein